ncbi:MAG: cytochrome C biogenesis protein [Sphingobacteriia bacterium]|nr:MAG: cytochrome C biogenesis protein [Sphingobacteriia bacterium]
MNNIQQIGRLVQKDFQLEFRQQYTFYGLVLYLVSTSFVVYLSLGQPEEKVWNALFWIIQLFVCINAVTKSFAQEARGRLLYFYTLSGPVNFMLAKLVYNGLLMLAMNGFSVLVFLLFLGNPLVDPFTFLGISLLSGLSISLLFTFLAAIAAKADQQASLMAIMGLPLIVPQLLLIMKLASTAFSSAIQQGFWSLVGMLAGLDILVIALAVILYPFLWKD